jgi:hypothetical protein
MSYLCHLSLLAVISLSVGQARAAGERASVSVSPASQVTDSGAPPALDVTPGCIPSWVIEGRTVRRLPDRCSASAGASATAGATAAATAPPVAGAPSRSAEGPRAKVAPGSRVNCRARRYWVDARGIRRLRPQCL